MIFSKNTAGIFFLAISYIPAFSLGLYSAPPVDSFMPGNKPPTVHMIIITGHHSDGTLDLVDASGNKADTIDVVYNDVIVWQRRDKTITLKGVKEKGSGDHFLDKPSTKNKWHGKIKSWPDNSKQQASYTIEWSDKNGNKEYDPLIRINPNTVE